MSQFIQEVKRSHMCGVLRPEHEGQEVVLMGWAERPRDHGGCVFIDLRDRTGISQIVFDPEDKALKDDKHFQQNVDLASSVRAEWVIAIKGKVRSRGANVNKNIPNGGIEILAYEIEVLNQSKTPPFEIADNIDTNEETRLNYRYLDLRRPKLQNNLINRHKFNQIVRRTLDENGFLELETPFLIKSTPEGARDYVVPSRVHSGQFFALPQSPQIFKQLFMVSGYDRYFQITRCFRDEDLRADRQPEFTQVDLEMSFCAQDDVMNIVEKILTNVWQDILGVDITGQFPVMTYHDALDKYGVDNPDLRFGLELQNISDHLKDCSFKVFADAIANGGMVKALKVPGGNNVMSRKQIDELLPIAKTYRAKGLANIRVKENMEWQSPIAKFFDEAAQKSLNTLLGLEVGDIVFFAADKKSVVNAALGNIRKYLGKTLNLIPENSFKFVWVVDFPAIEHDEESGQYFSMHHPFTSPKKEDMGKMLEGNLEHVKADAYDIVLNGNEIGGGSIRIHDQEVQSKVFETLGIGPEEAEQKFGFLLNALKYGAPPHGGLALGVDRIMMLIQNTPSIRDVIAFPKTQKQTDLMLNAPSHLDAEQLEELSLDIVQIAKEM